MIKIMQIYVAVPYLLHAAIKLQDPARIVYETETICGTLNSKWDSLFAYFFALVWIIRNLFIGKMPQCHARYFPSLSIPNKCS